MPHFMWIVRSYKWVLANKKSPSVFPISGNLFVNVEPLSNTRTPLADFFSIPLVRSMQIDVSLCYICDVTYSLITNSVKLVPERR
jgi:hypothetical protein